LYNRPEVAAVPSGLGPTPLIIKKIIVPQIMPQQLPSKYVRVIFILFYFLIYLSVQLGWNGMDWIDLAQDRYQWRALVNTVMNLRVP
jgi:ABC-type Fe3+ transport system permease subunit